MILPCVSGIVTSRPVFFCKDIKVKNICFIIKSCCHILFRTVHFNYIILILVWPTNVITTKMQEWIGCDNLTLGRVPKILQFDILISKCQWRSHSLVHPVTLLNNKKVSIWLIYFSYRSFYKNDLKFKLCHLLIVM